MPRSDGKQSEKRRGSSASRALEAHRHAVYRLADDLLLVFKPCGHTESEHEHPYGQRLRVLRGRLEVATARATRVLDARSAPFVLPGGRKHRTTALADTWLVAEKLLPPKRRLPPAEPPSAARRASGNRDGLGVATRAQHRAR
jgi:hypothetical protein